MAQQNHVNDPTFFLDAVEMFAFDYDWFYEGDIVIDDYGRNKTSFAKGTIRGSLQSQGTNLNLDLKGNTEDMKYNFYCMSKYRIKVGDFIFYKGRFLHVDFVQDYDEWGVRNCSLRMVNLNNYKDLEESIKYLNGDILV